MQAGLLPYSERNVIKVYAEIYMHIRILSRGHACIKEKKETLSIRPQAGVFRDCQPRFYQHFFKKSPKKDYQTYFFCLTFSPCLVYYRQEHGSHLVRNLKMSSDRETLNELNQGLNECWILKKMLVPVSGDHPAGTLEEYNQRSETAPPEWTASHIRSASHCSSSS